MSRDINPFGLRMPAELREAIEQACVDSGRSMNTEIIQRLQDSFRAPVRESVLFALVGRLEDSLRSMGERLDKFDPSRAAKREQLNSLAREVYGERASASKKTAARKKPR